MSTIAFTNFAAIMGAIAFTNFATIMGTIALNPIGSVFMTRLTFSACARWCRD
jgi:hypothetical protein